MVSVYLEWGYLMTGKLKRWFSIWKAQFQLQNIENRRCGAQDGILLIKLDAIGDFIIWLDSAKEYRKLFPQKKISLMCNEICRPIAENTGYFDKILAVDMKKLETDRGYFQQMTDGLKKLSFDMLIQTEYSRTLHMDMLAASISAREKVGYECDESRLNLSRRLLFHRNRKRVDSIYDRMIPADSPTKMELKRNADFLRGLGLTDFKSATPRLQVMEEKRALVPKEPYFVIFPGGSSRIKSWRTERFSEIIDYILDKTEWSAYICGSQGERELYEQIVRHGNRKEKIINYCGKTDLLELAEVVRNARLVISNDTSGIHYAAATGTKAVCIMGDQSYGRFLPYDADVNNDCIVACDAGLGCRGCVHKGMTLRCVLYLLRKGCYLCVDSVDVERVKRAVDEVLLKGEQTGNL